MRIFYIILTILILKKDFLLAMEQREEGPLTFSHLWELPAEEAYPKKIDERSLLSESEEKIILEKCVKSGHPIAKLEKGERMLLKRVVIRHVFHLENMPQMMESCHEIIPVKPPYSIIVEAKTYQKDLDLGPSKRSVLNQLAHEALTVLVETEPKKYEEYYKWFPEFFGLSGLHPYKPFENKTSLTREEFIELYSFWFRQYRNAKHLSKNYSDTDETVSFIDRYPTTQFWIQVLQYKGREDTRFPLFINRMLLKLDALPSESFLSDRLPWWRDDNWH